MAKPCNSKSSKAKVKSENQNLPIKCKLEIDYPPVINSDNLEMKRFVEKGEISMTKGKVRFQCHYEDRKRKAELRRRKIIQKLKNVYDIDVDDLTEDVTREIILKTEMLEKERKLKEKINVERTINILTKLLKEQKYKNKEHKIYHPPWRKTLKSVLCTEKSESFLEEAESFEMVGEMEDQIIITDEKELQPEPEDKKNIEALPTDLKTPENIESLEEKEGELVPECIPLKKEEEFGEAKSLEKLVRKPRVCKPLEKSLVAIPKQVIFSNYKKNKVYFQELKITNTGLETIHIRYLGIVVHTKGDDRYPIGVAVRDNVKLRPGLCCSTKIRLCSKDDTKELQCSVLYETRRQRLPLQHSWFYVPVICIPVRALVKVTPLKITFPSLTWCEATGPEGSQLYRKILKIENTGGKACSCKISNVKLKPNTEDVKEMSGEGREVDGEKSSVKSESEENYFLPKRSSSKEGFYGEGYFLPGDNYEPIARSLVDEMLEGVTTPFRFTPRFYIKIHPFSTSHVEVKFVPNYKGLHHELQYVQFEDCDNCKEQAIELVSDIKQLPLRVEPEVIDLKTCVLNSGVYAGTFKIYNESKGPFSVVFKIPPSIKNHAHVYPRTTTILPLNFSDVSVRIYPRITLLRDVSRYFNQNSQVLEFPIFIHPTNVGSCRRDFLKVYVFAVITDYCLELTPSFINFGTVTTLETVRTEVELTNHSLIIQEFGFLNLPKGVRIEPNMGFGRILPKESIKLFLLYSPDEDLLACDGNEQDVHQFKISVTSIAKYGGFREKLEPELVEQSDELFWGGGGGEEETGGVSMSSFTNEPTETIQAEEEQLEEEEVFDECEEASSIEDEELFAKIYEQENKIREFLKHDEDELSEGSLSKRKISQAQFFPKPFENRVLNTKQSEFGDFEECKETKGLCAFTPDLHIINCRAFVVSPRCRISESVIQLPSTSNMSFSLYRFRLKSIRETGDVSCSCGFSKVSKKLEKKQRIQISFEFQYFCPHIKLEPESGFLKPGSSIPITIIYRPKFSEDQGQIKPKSKNSVAENKPEVENLGSTFTTDSKKKERKTSSKNKIAESASKNTIRDVITNSSFLSEKDNLQRDSNLSSLANPFCIKTKLQCVIKIKNCNNLSEKTEIHEMVLICPVIHPNFAYLGDSQEIKFDKVFVGTKSRILLQFQNVSFEKIRPSGTLLNPVGAFVFNAGAYAAEVDPEHIWIQPLIFAPVGIKGIEKQFFEMYCNPTNIFLTVSGEGVLPKYNITPSFACCQVETKPGTTAELKLEIENLSPVKLNITVKLNFIKEGPELEEQQSQLEDPTSKKERTTAQKDDSKKKIKNSGNDNFQFWETVPEAVTLAVETFEDITEVNSNVFVLSGVNENNQIVIQPSAKEQIKVIFGYPADKSCMRYVVKYSFLLEGVSILHEILMMGKVSKVK